MFQGVLSSEEGGGCVGKLPESDVWDLCETGRGVWVGSAVSVAGAWTWGTRRLEKVESGLLSRQVHIEAKYMILEQAGLLVLSPGPAT